MKNIIIKKIILPVLLICTGIVAYVTGYVYVHMSNSEPLIKKRTYVMNMDIEQPLQEEFETKTTEELFILYPMYGEIWIYDSDGNFYDYTDVMLSDLNREEQLMVLKHNKVYTLDELYSFLESLTS